MNITFFNFDKNEVQNRGRFSLLPSGRDLCGSGVRAAGAAVAPGRGSVPPKGATKGATTWRGCEAGAGAGGSRGEGGARGTAFGRMRPQGGERAAAGGAMGLAGGCSSINTDGLTEVPAGEGWRRRGGA